MYEIILYDTEDERCPVQELLYSLEPIQHAMKSRKFRQIGTIITENERFCLKTSR